jgi:hypothetical protein
MVLPCGREALPLCGAVQAVEDVIVFDLGADGELEGHAPPRDVPAAGRLQAGRHAAVGLVELVSADRVIQERRQNWSGLPSPLYWLTICPGVASSASPGRYPVRASSCC